MKHGQSDAIALSKMKNKFIFLFFAIVLVSFASANLGTFKQFDCVEIKTILNTTSVNVSTISYPNSTIVLTNVEMSQLGQTFNYSFCNTSTIGTYTYDYFDAEGNVYVNDFTITPTGTDLTTSKSILFVLFIIGIIGVFFLCLYFSIKIPFKNQRNEDDEVIGINELKYVKIFLICMDYVILLLFFGLVRGIFGNYVSEAGVISFFDLGYTIFISLLWPIIVVTFILTIIFLLNDNKLRKDIDRGLVGLNG